MSKLLINIKDGTVCTLADTVVIDTDKLDDAGKELLKDWDESGSDGSAEELGTKYGTPLEKFTNNDLTHAYSIAFSAIAVRDEVRDRIDSGYATEEYKLANSFTMEQFDELGQYILQYILQSDYLWNVFSEELSSGIRNYARDIMGRSI